MQRVSLLFAATTLGFAASNAGIDGQVEHHFAHHDGVKLHYAALGSGPLIVMIHGYPDFWYTWRDQMAALAPKYRVVAMDNRGYNLSDKPSGVENYDIKLLVGDVEAVIRDAGSKPAIIVGHDWGGFIAWNLAMTHPESVDKLIVLNLPHPRNLMHELATNPEQRKNSQYARNNQLPDAASKVNLEKLAGWVRDPDARQKYIEAFKRSDPEALLNYYKANYPREPYSEDPSPVVKVKCPVLQIHGLNDKALLAGALNNTWEFVEKDWTLVTIPGAGHFVQQDASELVTRSIIAWLNR